MPPRRARSPAQPRYSKANDPLPSELMQMIDDRRRDAELNDPRIGWPDEMYGVPAWKLDVDRAALMSSVINQEAIPHGTPNYIDVWRRNREAMFASEEYLAYGRQLHKRADLHNSHEHMQDSPTGWAVDMTEPPLVRLARESESVWHYKKFAPSVTPLAWLAIPAAVGTKLAYERYFGPEETKKAAEMNAPYHDEMIDHMARDITRGDYPGDDQSHREEYYKEKTLAWNVGLRDGWNPEYDDEGNRL